MESGKSSNGKDIDNAFHSECETDCEKVNSVKTSTNAKENEEGNPNTSPDSSTHSKNEREASRRVLLSKTEKLPIEYEVSKPRISTPKFSNETDLESKDNSLQKFTSIVPDESVKETKDSSTQISNPVIPDGSLLGSEAILTGITSPVSRDEGSSDSMVNKARIAILEVSDETDLESKIGSLQRSSSDENASGNNTTSHLLSSITIPNDGNSESSPITSSITIPSEGDSESSPLPSGIFAFHASRKDCLSLEGNESFYKFTENSTRNRGKGEWAKAVRRQKRYQLPPKDNPNTGHDCQVVSPSQTKNIPIKWKFSSFRIFGSTNPEETATETKENLTLRTSLTVPDVTVSESKGQFSSKRSPDVFDETSLDNEFNSLQITNPGEVYKENTASLPREPSLLDSVGDLLNPGLELKIDACIENILRRTSSQENESYFKVPETSPTKRSTRMYKKAVLKQKRYQSPSKVNKNVKHCLMSPIKDEETQIEFEEYSLRMPSRLDSDESDSENDAGLPGFNRIHDIDEDTLRGLDILSCDCLFCLPKLPQRSSRSIYTTEHNKEGINLKTIKSHPESSLRDNPVNLSIPSTSKIFPRAKSAQNVKYLQGARDTNNPDESRRKSFAQVDDSSVQSNRNSRDSRRNSRRNRNTDLPFSVENNRTVKFPVPNNPLRIIRSAREPTGCNTQHKSETNRNQSQSSFSKANNEEANRNQCRSSFSKADNEEMNRNRSPSGSRKTDNNERKE